LEKADFESTEGIRLNKILFLFKVGENIFLLGLWEWGLMEKLMLR
jgi:hypothetical protein